MDIHKPKAAHSIREFLIEIGTIICGILIALGLEQVVEGLRVQREVAETREALNAEIAENVMRAKIAIAENTCSAAIQVKALARLRGGPKPPMDARAMLLPLSSSVWDTAHTTGVAHTPLDEQLRFARFYDLVRLYDENETRRREVGLRGASILLVDRLTHEQASRLEEDLNGSDVMRGYQTGNARRAIDYAAAMRIEPAVVNPKMRDGLERYCRQAGVPIPPL